MNIWEKDFLGGTLVEYKWGCDWYSHQEFSRGTITKYKLDRKRKSAYILTDSAAKMLALLNIDDYRHGIWYLGSSPYFNVMYCLAEKGIEIPL